MTTKTATPLQKNGLDGLPDHFWQVQVRRADDGQCIFTGFITAKSMAAAFREAARHWPGCAIRIEGKDAPARGRAAP